MVCAKRFGTLLTEACIQITYRYNFILAFINFFVILKCNDIYIYCINFMFDNNNYKFVIYW